MTLNNPSLVLTFLGDDLPAGHSASQTISNEYIINYSISFNYQLMNNLKSSSNQVALQISRDCSATEDIIATDGDILATLKNGYTVLFTGFVSTNFSWKVTQNGEQALSITLEDRSVRLLTKCFIASGYHLFNCQANVAIAEICASVGIEISSSAISITDTITKVVDSSMTCRDILDQMLYELGYVYYCDNLGELRFWKVDCTSVTGIPVLDKTKLYISSGTAVQLSKKIRQYRSVRITYKELRTASNYLVYRNTTGQGADVPYCQIELQSGEHFDGLEVYTAEEWAEETADEFREDALVEACNAASETVMVGSNKIISISNVSPDIVKETGITANITAAGGPYLKIDVSNNADAAKKITKLDAYASIIYEKSINIIRTGIAGDTTDSLFSEELSYVHSRELTTRHANLLCQYYAYCNSQYTFFSKENLSCGDLVHISENVWTGLGVDVLITGKTVPGTGDVVKYTAIGISVFDLDKEAYHRSTDEGKADTKGATGHAPEWKQGTALSGTSTSRGAEGVVGDYYLNTDTQNVYKCIASGTASTALWEYVLCMKGDAATFDGTTFTIEYAMSTSDELVKFEGVHGNTAGAYGSKSGDGAFAYGFNNDIWSETVENWHLGLYVWQRIRTNYTDGTVGYSEATYCKDMTESLIASCRFELQPIEDRFIVNKARTGNRQYLIKLSVTGYPETFAAAPITAAWATDSSGSVAAGVGVSRVGNVVTITVPYKTIHEQININVNGRYGETTSCSMTADDQTQYDVYGGCFEDDASAAYWFLTNCGGQLEGYSYVNTTSNTIRYYNGTSWELLDIDTVRKSGIILSQAEKDFWELFESLPEAQRVNLWDMYGYKKSIITSSLAASKIIMYGEGVIASKNVDTDTTKDIDANGFLTKEGYRLEGENGKIRSKGSYFNEANAQNLRVYNELDLQNAQISHPAISTYEGAEGDPTGVSDSLNAWPVSDIYNNQSLLDGNIIGNGDVSGTIDCYLVRRSQSTLLLATLMPVVEKYNTNNFYFNCPLKSQWATIIIWPHGTVELNGYANLEVNGTVVATKTFEEKVITEQELLFSYSGEIPMGATVELTGNLTAYGAPMSISFASLCQDNSFISANFPNTGLYLHYLHGSWLYLAPDEFPNDVHVELAPIAYNGSTLGMNYDSDNNLRYCVPEHIGAYHSYVDSSSVSHTLTPGLPYKANGTLYDYQGNSYQVVFVTVNTAGTEITVTLKRGGSTISATMNTGRAQSYYGSLAIATTLAGVEMMGQYPKADQTYDLGSVDRYWDTGYIVTVQGLSKKSEKKDIRTYQRSALNILNNTKIVRFKYKKDKAQTPHIGFIAEDTDKDLSGKKQDSFMVNDTIAVLIKAVQEMSAEIAKLKGGGE